MLLSQIMHEVFKGAVERIPSPRTVSAFREKGVLSVEEFGVATDNLVSNCPTWSWYDKYYPTPRVWLTGYDEVPFLISKIHGFGDPKSQRLSMTIQLTLILEKSTDD